RIVCKHGGGTLAARRHSNDTASMSTATVPSAYALLSVMRTKPSGRGSRRSCTIGAQQSLAARQVQCARPPRRVETKPIPRRAERLVIGERLRLERRKPPHPLRPRGRRLARDGRGGEGAFAISFGAAFVVLVEGPKKAAPATLTLDPPNPAFEHLPDPTRLQMPQPLPHELAFLLVVSTVERDHVQMGVQPEIGRRALCSAERPRLRTPLTRPTGIERLDGLDEDAREPAEPRAVLRQPAPPRERECQHPLPQQLLAGRGEGSLTRSAAWTSSRPSPSTCGGGTRTAARPTTSAPPGTSSAERPSSALLDFSGVLNGYR